MRSRTQPRAPATASGRSRGTPASIREPTRISSAIAMRKARTGLRRAPAAIDHMAQVGRFLTRVLSAVTDLDCVAPLRSTLRPAPHPRRATAPAGSSRGGSPSDRCAASVHRQSVQRRNQAIASAVKKTKMGLSDTAAFTRNHDCIASAGKLCIAFLSIRTRRQDIQVGSGSRPGRRNPLARHWVVPPALSAPRAYDASRSTHSGAGLGSAATSGHGRSARRSNRAIERAERIASPALSPTATAATSTAQVGRLSMRVVPVVLTLTRFRTHCLKNCWPPPAPVGVQRDGLQVSTRAVIQARSQRPRHKSRPVRHWVNWLGSVSTISGLPW